MLPERLEYISEFEKFSHNLIQDVKENKYNQAEFNIIMIAKIKSMDRDRRERKVLLSKKAQ